MPLTPDDRQEYRRWLIARELRPEVADAILETMPPFDWSNIARRDDLNALTAEVDRRFQQVDTRFERVETRLSSVETRLGSVETRLGSVETRLGRVEDGLLHVGTRVDALNHTLSVAAMGLVVTLVLGFSSIFAGILLSI